ncbi:MAG: Tim44 domain-containing protein [Rubrivivax sp.]
MKNWLAGGVALVVAVALALPNVADAKRLAGGKNAGMQRSAPAQQAPNSAQGTPAQPAAPQSTSPTPAAAPAAAGATATAATAAAAPAKRSWMGPIAGLAAGLGLAALASYFGFGEALANFLMIALLAVAAIFLVRFLMRRFGTPARSEPSLAGAGAGAAGGSSPLPMGAQQEENAPVAQPAPIARSAFQPAAGSEVSVTGRPLTALGTGPEAVQQAPVAAQAAAGPALPEGFDLPAFERVAKMIFIRLQAANDKSDLEDLRQFTTPELFASLRLDLQERGSAPQTTDVERVDAQVVEFATEEGREIVSVRFHGLIREEASQAAEAFDEVWHLVRPVAGGNWAIAGIQQSQ